MSAVGEVWVQWFRCCMAQPQAKRPRIRIDRSMISTPSNFQHLSHVGARDVELRNDQLVALQRQMQSKGDYSATYKESEWCTAN